MVKEVTQEEMNQRKIIAENIRKYLRQSTYNQTTLAERAGISKSTMSDYLNLRAKPSHGVLQKIADAFEVGKSDIDTTYKDKPTSKAELLAAHIDDDVSDEEMAQIINYIDLIKKANRS